MREPLWTSEAISVATNGRTTGSFSVNGISIDSRQQLHGDLFVAIVGNRFDGHGYVETAIKAGAAGAMVHETPPGMSPNDPRLIFVNNTFTALQDLARAARRRSKAHVVAITGSVGKTGTKEMLRAGFEPIGPCHANEGNLNNHIGVPLSLARMPSNTKFAVFELGMNHSGEICALTKLVNPNTAIITRIAPAHMESFSTIEAVADAKAEIFAGLTPKGTAILNADDPLTERLTASVPTHSKTFLFGKNEGANVKLLSKKLYENGSQVSAQITQKPISWELKLPGAHWVQNSLAVVAALHVAGADLPICTRAISQLEPLKGRGSRHRLCGIDVIDESYNASPAAVRAAFTTLALSKPNPGGKRVFILGDMLELGESAAADHAALAKEFMASGLDRAHGAGPLALKFLEALPPKYRGKWAMNSDELASEVDTLADAGDVILVKGSFSTNMSKIVAALEARQLQAESQTHAV